jgi:hypothetical protein
MPSRCAASGVAGTMGRPCSSICPASGRCTPVRHFTSVDLPAPFCPISACTSPACMRRLAPRSAATPAKRLSMPRRSSTGAAAAVVTTCALSTCGSGTPAMSAVKMPSLVLMRLGSCLPAATSLTMSISCGPSSGLHSTLTFILPAIMASNAPLTASTEITLMSVPGFMPASSMAWMAPMAMSSLCAYSTLIFLPSALRKASITSLPLARVKSPVWLRMIL